MNPVRRAHASVGALALLALTSCSAEKEGDIMPNDPHILCAAEYVSESRTPTMSHSEQHRLLEASSRFITALPSSQQAKATEFVDKLGFEERRRPLVDVAICRGLRNTSG
jgi:hypothetical protein